MRAAWALLVVVAGCVPTRASVTSARWHAVDTPNIHLETDLPAKAAVHRAELLEREIQQTRFLYQLLGVPPRPGIAATKVVVFADCEDLQWVGRGSGVGRSADLDEAGFAVRCEEASFLAGRDQRRELASILNRDYFGELPWWLELGLGAYFAGATRSGDVITLGPPRRISEDNLSFDKARTDPSYFAAWRIVHAMLNTSEASRQQPAQFLAALAMGIGEAEAWATTMLDVEDQIRRTFMTSRARDPRPWKLWAEPSTPFEPSVRVMGSTEVAARLVDRHLPSTLGEGWSRRWLRSDLEHLRRIDSSGDTFLYWHALAAYRTGSPKIGDPLALFTAYVKRRPDDLRGQLGWFLVSFRAITGHEPDLGSRLDALAETARKIVPVAITPTALEALARFWMMRGELPVALPFVRRAVERDPRCSRCFETLARIRHEQGVFADAVAAQERAISLLVDKPPRPAMLEALARYRAAQVPPPPPP